MMKAMDQWQKIFDVITDQVMILNLDFKIKHMNKAAVDFFGLPVPELIGKHCYVLMHGTDAPPEECPLAKMISTREHQEAEMYVENRGMWINVSVDPILDDEGRIVEIIHIVKDITDRKEKEDLLRKSEERYRSIFNHSPIGLIEMNGSAIKKRLEELSASGVDDLSLYLDDHPEEARRLLSLLSFVDVNNTVLSFSGFQRKEDYFKFIRQLLWDVDTKAAWESPLVDDSTRGMIFRGFKETITNLEKGINFFEGELSFPMGVDNEDIYFNLRWSVPSGHEKNYDKVLISLINITKTKRAEAALRESEDKYRNVIEKSLAGFFIVQDDIFRFVNQRFCDIVGYSHDELCDKMSALELTHPEDRRKVKANIDKRLSGEVDTVEYEFRTIRKDGKVITLKILGGSMMYKGKPAVTGTMIDVTNERNLEFQLRQAHKMEAIGTLAGGIAHDFNNLLMTILGYTSLMLTNADIDSEDREYLKIIEEQVQKGADLTKQLLGFARGGKYEVKPTDLNDLLSRTSELFSRTKKEIRIFKKQEEDIWIVDVDRGQIEQVFLNLLVNAWQAMPAGGDLYLETSNVVIDANHSRSSYLEPGRYVRVSVTDQGAGMDEVTKQRIFEPFFTTKEMGRGTGLGLASAYGIIKNHGGFINVYSERGQGTTFNIYLPVSDKEVFKEKAVVREVLKGSEMILLIDDQKPVVQVGESMLKALGYEVLTSEHGEDAIAVYQKQQKKIDLVILDMIMPGMSGSEVFDALKTINPQIKVVLSSGYSMNGQASSILARGCNGFIQKPFSLVDLSRKIREVLDEEPLFP
ncbi:MAG: PAS domain S-box protein [Deltaproteobacteria bacterium]|nr:PAS domain S-box protein [Deltaproteobacteria bacterium]